MIKRLRLLHHALLELSTLQVSESHREAPQPSASSMADEDNNQHSNSTTANGHKTHSSTETAGGASLNGGAISSGNGNGIGIDRNGPGSEGGVSGGREGDTWAPAAAELLQEVLEELPALAALPSEAIQEEVARCVLVDNTEDKLNPSGTINHVTLLHFPSSLQNHGI